MVFETKIGRAKSKGNSLKTTIPMNLVKFMGLQSGDTLRWKCEIKNDTIHIELEPAIESSK